MARLLFDRRTRYLCAALWAAAWLGVAAALLMPLPVPAPVGGDLVAHFLIFGVMAFATVGFSRRPWQLACLALATIACATALEFARSRVLFGRPLIHTQTVHRRLADMVRRITTGQLLALRLGQLKDAGRLHPSHVSLAKWNNVRLGLDVAREARDLLGAGGITVEFHAIRHMLNLESVITYEGTETIHELVVGREIAGREVLTSWQKVLDYCKAAMAFEEREQFRILFLDKKNALIADEVQHVGTVDHTMAYPREVLRRALALSATAVVLAHNHPSGDATPSRAYIDMTKAIVDALKPAGIAVHDHIIVGKKGFASMKGLMLI